LNIRDRIELARQKDYISVQECALLVGVSERTVWRRLPHLGQLVRTGRITRLNRRTALRYFLNLSPRQDFDVKP
jgi:DeoR/GlpR family transcriptional regulator of sugar metabolism